MAYRGRFSFSWTFLGRLVGGNPEGGRIHKPFRFRDLTHSAPTVQHKMELRTPLREDESYAEGRLYPWVFELFLYEDQDGFLTALSERVYRSRGESGGADSVISLSLRKWNVI